MSKIILLSDSHLGHSKMQEYCGRPSNFESLILKNLASATKGGGTLIHLGDVCFGNDAKWHNMLWEAMKDCDLRILVRGNHDKQSDSWYMNHGWSFVCEAFQNVYFGKRFLFSHRPMDAKYVDLQVFGHFHNHLPRILEKKFVIAGEEERNEPYMKFLCDKSRLVSLEYTNYKPVNLQNIIDAPSAIALNI